MKKFSIVALLLVFALMSIAPVMAQDPVTITWFIGLGTGSNPEQREAQDLIVAEFNAANPGIVLETVYADSFEVGRDLMSTLIAAGESPDIVGPVGVGGSNAFVDQWADLTSLVESTGYDLSAFDPALVDLYRTADGKLVGIPFAVFPSVTYYNVDLFDEAGLEYPPSEFGEMYVLDGEEVEWNYDTVIEVAKILTVDANGNDATMDEFDPSNIIQFGFNFQWAQYRLMLTHLAPEAIYDGEANSITIPDSWVAASEWIQDAIWGSSFSPNAVYEGSELLAAGGGAFATGNLAMAVTPLWYTCCLGESIDNFNWEIGVVPMALDGQYHVATDADTFRLTVGSKYPEEAFVVLSYLLDEAVPVLAPVYGAFPARPEYQQPFLDSKAEQYPFVENWEVAPASLAYNNPNEQHHEAFFPNWQKGADRIQAFWTLLQGDTGANIDVAAELEALEADLNAIVNE